MLQKFQRIVGIAPKNIVHYIQASNAAGEQLGDNIIALALPALFVKQGEHITRDAK
jgi:hypothetical protein